MSDCELGLGYLLLAALVGLSFGACTGTVVAGLLRSAATVGVSLPVGPPSGDSLADLRRDVDAWYAATIAQLDAMSNGGGR
jgi:hypothetical protein